MRSGKFVQGTHGLRFFNDKVNTYCCLGVAGKVVGLENDVLDARGIYSTDCFTSEDLRKFVDKGVPQILVSFRDLDVAHHLQLYIAKMNDGTKNVDNPNVYEIEPKTFAEIADWIEATL